MSKKNLGQQIAVLTLRYRWLVIIGTIAFMLLCASGGRFLGMSTDYRVFFSGADPHLIAFETLENRFSKNDNVLIAVAPTDGEVFTKETLKVVKELTWAAWKLPYSSRVDSITNFQHTRAQEDDLIVGDMVPDTETLSTKAIASIKKIVLSEPLLSNRLISSKGYVTGINITFQMPGKTIAETPEIVQAARELVNDYRHKYPDINFYVSGMIMLNNAFSETAQKDMATFLPFMFFIMSIIMWVALRSVSGTAATLIIIITSVATAMGIAGWMGVLITPPSSTAPTIILTLAIADSIHILSAMLHEMRMGKEKREAIIESIRINLQPVTLTSITTAIGFLSMNFSDAPPFHDLGNIVAIGVMAALFYTLLLLPPLMSFLPVHVKKRSESDTLFMDKFGDFVVDNRKSLLWGMTVFILILSTGLPRIEFYDVFSEYFDTRNSFRTDTDFIRDNLTGIDMIEFSLGALEEGGISSATYLATVESFTQWFRKQPEVMHVNSFTDIMKRINKNMHGDDPAFYTIPEGNELAAQYLLLYEMSLPFGMDLNNQINVAKSATRFIVTLKRNSSVEIKEVAKRGEEWLRENAPPSMFTNGSSPSVMFSHITLRNIISMLTGTTFALILISLIMIFALGSFKVGAISLIPNLVPAAMSFGLWGLLISQVGMGLSLVSAMSLGIVVDDTIHFLSKYMRARREHGMTSPEAVRYSFHTVGTALWITSLILIGGFSVMAFSNFKMNSDMGILTAIAIMFALPADFLLLPPILMKMDSSRIFSKRTKETMIKGITIFFSIAILCFPAHSSAQTREAKGLEIAKEADNRDSGFKDFSAQLTMTLSNRLGEKSMRRIHSKTLEGKNDGDKTLIVFENPKDVKGTAMLTFTHKTGNDDQWLYLPALKRVKRISSSNKSGSFMGSEFAYEDVGREEVEKYTYKWIRDEACPGEEFKGLTCFVSERIPVDKNSGYTRQIEWRDQKEYRQIQIDFYDRKESHLKTLTFRGYTQYLNRYWRPEEMHMLNRQSGKNTLLTWKDYAFKTGLKERDFRKNSLKRAR